MGRRSYTPSPPRGYGRRGRSPCPKGRSYSGSRGRDLPTSLLVRNLRHDCRPEDLRRPFGQFGPLKDVYLPRDYYSGEPRGFGFVQFIDPNDAAEAKYQLDGQILLGRQLTVVFAEENRKKPSDMRVRERRGGSGRFNDRRRSSSRYSRSPPRRYSRSRSRSRDYSPPIPKRRHYYLRSVSPPPPRGKMYSRERSFSRSPMREGSPPYDDPRSRSQSPVRERERSPPSNGSRSRSSSRREHSPIRGENSSRSRSRSPSRSRSRSLISRDEQLRGDSSSQ